MPSRTQGGDRVGHELLSVVGVVSKFGPPKSHKFHLNSLIIIIFILGVSLTLRSPFGRVGVAGTLYPVSPFVRFAIVTSTGVPTKLDQSGLVHPSCC